MALNPTKQPSSEDVTRALSDILVNSLEKLGLKNGPYNNETYLKFGSIGEMEALLLLANHEFGYRPYKYVAIEYIDVQGVRKCLTLMEDADGLVHIVSGQSSTSRPKPIEEVPTNTNGVVATAYLFRSGDQIVELSGNSFNAIGYNRINPGWVRMNQTEITLDGVSKPDLLLLEMAELIGQFEPRKEAE